MDYEPVKNQPLTALYLLTILEKTFGGRLDLALADLRGVSESNIPHSLPEHDIYCYTAFSPLYKKICEIKDCLKGLYPESLHLISGPHVDLFCEQVKGFDAIAMGDGEINIVHMLHDILNGSLQGIYRNCETIDLDDYPYPSRKYQPASASVDTCFLFEDRMLRASNVLFSRGCPNRCHYCANRNVGHTHYRHPGLVEEEIAYLKDEYGVEALVFRDYYSIPVNRGIAKPFLQAIVNSKVKWRGQASANGIPEDMVALAAESGCLDLGLGIDSVSDRVLNVVNKKIDLQRTKDFIKLLKKYKIGVKLNLIIGLPGEPEDIVSQMVNFIDETGPRIVGLALFCPFPGSKITNDYKEFGIKKLHPHLHEYHIHYWRYDEMEKPRLLFEYNDITPWGNGMRPEEIIENFNTLQEIFRKRHLAV